MVVRKLARFCWLSNNFCRLHKLGSSSLLEKYKSTLAEPPLDILVRDISRVLSQRRRDVEEPMPGPSYLQDKEGQQQQKGPRLTRSEIMDTLCDLGIQCKLTPHTGRVQIYCPECGTHRLFISPRNNSAMCIDCGYQASFTELCDLLKKSGKDSERTALQWRDSNRTVVNKDPLSSKYRFEAEARPPVDNKGAKMNDHDGIARYSSLEELDSDIYDRVSYLNLMSEYEKKERQRKLEEIESLRRLRDEAEKLSSRSPRGKAIDSLSEKNNMIPSVDPMIRMIWADAIDLYDVRDVAEQSDFLALRKELGVDRISYDTLSRFYVKGHMDAYDHPALCYPRYRGPCGRTRPPAGLKIIRRVGERLEKENFPEPDESGRRVFSGIFGYHLVAASDQRIVLTTNERDAMAVYEATGGLLSIALPMGEKLDENVLPYLEEFDIVYLWFPFIHDKYAKDYASFLNANRCQIINHQERPIELLRGGRLAEIDVAIRRRAVRVRSKGFRSMIDVRSDLKSELINSHSKQFGIARWKRFDVLNKYLLGFRPRELTVITGGTGFGKTTFLCEYSLDLLSQGVRTLFCSFEMPDEKVLKWMLVQFAALPLYRVEHHPSVELWLDRFERTKGDLIIMKVDEFRDKTITEIAEALRNQVIAAGIQHVVIDNLQFLIGLATLHSEKTSAFDKFNLQDRFVGLLRSIATDCGPHITLVVHPRKTDSDTDLDIQHFGGSARVTQEADNVFAIQRRRDSDDHRKFRKFLYILKNRYGQKRVETDQIEMVFQPATYTHTLIDLSLSIGGSTK